MRLNKRGVAAVTFGTLCTLWWSFMGFQCSYRLEEGLWSYGLWSFCVPETTTQVILRLCIGVISTAVLALTYSVVGQRFSTRSKG